MTRSFRQVQSPSADIGMTPRSRDTAGPGVRHPQKLHLHPGAHDGSNNPKGGQGPQGMGLPDRQEEAEDTAEQKQVMQHDLLYLT